MPTKYKPTPVHDPELVILNEELASTLNLDFSKTDKKQLAEIFSGNSIPEETDTIAQAYAGHQFGHFTMLGDGRAVLLGEHLVNNDNRFDIQFKGSGRTSFSRGVGAMPKDSNHIRSISLGSDNK